MSANIHDSAPFPLEGGRVGDGGGDRSARAPHGPVPGGVVRARRLRREMTVAERLLWVELRKFKANFRRQVPIGRYVADFAHLSSRLIIEVDGYRHTTPDGSARDAERDAWFAAEGYRILRVPEAEVRHRLSEIVERIAAETAPPPSPTLPPSRGKGDARYTVR